MFACGIRSARGRSFEESRGETEVGRRMLAPQPRPLPPLALRTRPAGTQTEPQLEAATSAGVRYFAWNWTIPVVMLATVVATTVTLSSNSCKFLTHFTSVLRKQFAANDTLLREANGHKRALALRNAR